MARGREGRKRERSPREDPRAPSSLKDSPDESSPPQDENAPPLHENAPPQDVLDAGLRLLTVRARSIQELRNRLKEKGYSKRDVAACIHWLRERKLLDDRAFAASFVRDRIRLSPRSAFLLKRELRERGIAPELAEAVPNEVLEEEGWTEDELAARVARAWVRKQASGLRKALVAHGFTDEKERARRRLMGFLARRGFTSDAARKGLEAAERFVRDLENLEV